MIKKYVDIGGRTLAIEEINSSYKYYYITYYNGKTIIFTEYSITISSAERLKLIDFNEDCILVPSISDLVSVVNIDRFIDHNFKLEAARYVRSYLFPLT